MKINKYLTGIITVNTYLVYDEDTKDEYDSLQVREYMISNYKDTIERRVYPDRLYPLLIKKKDKKSTSLIPLHPHY